MSLAKCHTIYKLPEREHAWPRLHMEEMLRKVGLLPAIYVETIKAPVNLGEHFA